MAKMFYTTEEAAARLSVSGDQLKQFVSDNKLREFRDGTRVMFKVDQVDRLATESGAPAAAAAKTGLSDTGIHLAPGPISLEDDAGHKATKDDTVVTGSTPPKSSHGTTPGSISSTVVFESGEIKAADASAQTQIQPALEDQLSLEGVGSGSGLLDLTRESDDTSLGAELLDEIYPGGEQKQPEGIGSASGIFDKDGAADAPSASPTMEGESQARGAVDIVEARDTSSGAFGGLALASLLIMGTLAMVAVASYLGVSLSWVEAVTADVAKIAITGVVLLVVSGLFMGVGFFVGKATGR